MRKLLLAVCISALALMPGQAWAQIDVGGQISYAGDVDLGIGARGVFSIPVETFSLKAIGTFDYFFPDAPADADVTYWELNANVIYPISLTDQLIEPYAGAGLNIAHGSASVGTLEASETDLGLNILGGILYDAGPFQPFAEVRLEIGGGDQYVITGGILFNITPGM